MTVFLGPGHGLCKRSFAAPSAFCTAIDRILAITKKFPLSFCTCTVKSQQSATFLISVIIIGANTGNDAACMGESVRLPLGKATVGPTKEHLTLES
jgi:hypothetical protein